MNEITKSQALELLDLHVKNTNLKRHCLAVGATMRSLADRLGYSDQKDEWEILGILHDSDWEETKDDINSHTKKTLKWLENMGISSGPIVQALKSHNNRHTSLKELSGDMEWSLECCDELTGFIVACTLVSPSKKIADLTPESILKKFPQKAFAAAVDRSQIQQCEEKLKIPLEDFVNLTLKSMQSISDQIGL